MNPYCTQKILYKYTSLLLQTHQKIIHMLKFLKIHFEVEFPLLLTPRVRGDFLTSLEVLVLLNFLAWLGFLGLAGTSWPDWDFSVWLVLLGLAWTSWLGWYFLTSLGHLGN